MSKIKHWNEVTQSWEIDGASNANNIELTNPGFVDENGNSISVDQGFTKIDNRLSKIEQNVAWIYQNGAKGGGGMGGGSGSGTIDSTSYTINIEEGNRVYTSDNSITIHITITGGSVKKSFSVIIQDSSGNTKGTYVVSSLTRTEITINNLNDSINRLTINANTGQNYATPVTLTVVAGAITLDKASAPDSTIYPTTLVRAVIINANNSTDSDLAIIVNCNGEKLDEFTVSKAKNTQFRVDSIVEFLNTVKTQSLGESYTFEIYARGVLNDTILQSKSIVFTCTIASPNVLYIVTYDVNKSTPTDVGDLADLNKFVYGGSIKFDYKLTYSDQRYPFYRIEYTVTPCRFEQGILVSEEEYQISGLIGRVEKDTVNNVQFIFNTASLPSDTIYDPTTNQFKFVKVTLHAISKDSDSIEDYKTLYFTLAEAATKYITATNFTNNLIAYFSPVMGVPTGNMTRWQYDNRNTRFTYSSQGIVQQRYINLIGHNLNYFMNQSDMQGVHLEGKSWVDLGINLFSVNANEVNLFNGTGWTLSFTFRTDANIDDSDVVVSLGKWEDQDICAGIEIRANKVIYAIQKTQYSLNITKGDLVTIDIVAERYIGPGDSEDNPAHWFMKVYLNGVLSLVTSHSSGAIFNTDNNGMYGWYFDEYLHIGGRVINNEITDAASVHLYDLKVYSSALSDNEIVQNYISATIYSELGPNASPNMSDQNEMLQKNFIQIGTDGDYHSILFDEDDETQYKDATSLLSSLVGALAESRIPYPIVVVNQLDPDSNFLGITESKFNEDLKETVMSSRFPINIDYYTMGNQNPIKIENISGTRMSIGIQGTSSLRYNSKNYEIYMGQDDENKDVLVQIREDWLPENRYTLKADVMDSSHVNNVLIGKIINGLVTTVDSQGNEVPIRPLDNTPPMSKNGYAWASKVKHTSEGFPCILFINFKASGSNVSSCRCMGIYNFNLGRYAYFNLGLKLLSSVNYTTTEELYPRMIESYTEETEIEAGSPVYSMEVQENNTISMFDQDDPNILTEGVFEFPYDSDGQGMSNLSKLLSFLASFGYNIETDRKVYIDNDWKTPRMQKIDGTWQASGRYYSSYDPRYYVKSTLDLHMNWNNMVSYYIIAIVFGLVDSMAKNMTLRSWNTISDGQGGRNNIWYTCFYDMDTALRVNNVGAETVSYNAHLHRYYTDTSSIAEARVQNHCSTIFGVFNQEYSGYNTRLQEIVENINVGYDSTEAKTLQSVYKQLRTNLFPDPAEFIDKYYSGQINQIGAALYNYDYYLKYLQVEKTYNPATQEYGNNTYNYTEISYLHGNGSTNVKDWFVKRIKFLDGVYGMSGYVNGLEGIKNTPLATQWMDNNATKIENISSSSVQLTLQAESQIRISFATSGEGRSFWIDETPRDYRISNVGGTQVVTIYSNKYLTQLGKFDSFTWNTLGSLDFPLIKELSLRNQNILVGADHRGFLTNANNLESLIKFDLHGVKLLYNSSVVYIPLEIAQSLPNLEELDISDSSFSDVPLSQSSVLRKLNLANTKITSLTYSNQPMLEELIIGGCNELKSISLSDCPKLKSITIPESVETIYLGNCENIEELIAPYNGSSRYISNLREVTIASCPNLKVVDFSNQNNPLLDISLIGASGIENLYLQRIVTTKIIFAEKSRWTSLKTLDLSATQLGTLHYLGSTLNETVLDLEQFTNLESLVISDNGTVTDIICPNIEGHKINLTSGAVAGCGSLKNLYGNFLLSGSRIFSQCGNLVLNDDRIYNNNAVINYNSVPFINDPRSCNISIDPNINSVSELFSGCTSLTGNDFNLIMLLLHDNITNISRMFTGCSGIDADLRYDTFRHCPNVIDMTAFASGSGLRGGIYSRATTYSDEDTTTWGTFDFIRNVKSLTEAFISSKLEFIDNDAFAPYMSNEQLTYFDLRDMDNMFAYCPNLASYAKYSTREVIPGNLQSKTFFTNLRKLGRFPKGLFEGCTYVNMDINSDYVAGQYFDYLFTFPTQLNVKTLDSSIYSGINLLGEIHPNIFGGLLDHYQDNYIASFTVIDGPFSQCKGVIYCNLSNMGNIFSGIKDTLLQAKNVFEGVRFSNSEIPTNIFAGCTKLNSISKFFAYSDLTNQDQVFEFPQYEMFKDCTSLKDVSFLFQNAHNLNIKLVGSGFRNCPLTNVEGMLKNSGVFGQIPYKLFYNSSNSISNISKVFEGCFKLGYSKDRTIGIGIQYEQVDDTYETKWEDCIITNEGTRIPFELDFTDFEGDDEWYIDGRDWADINPELASSPAYSALSDVFEWDRQQKQALSVSRDRKEGYQNYMFPADYFKYCSANCTMEEAFKSFTYDRSTLIDDGTGTLKISATKIKDGLVGRLPCKLFSNNTQNKEFKNVFKNLNFCAFINFNSYKFVTLGQSFNLCRGIKLPPDLLQHNTELTSIEGLFYGINIEVGVDINSDLLVNNTKLVNVSSLFRNCLFSEYNYYEAPNGEHSQINFEELFRTCGSLSNVSNLFYVDNMDDVDRGLRIIRSTLFGTSTVNEQTILNNPFITNVSGMFYNNKRLKGNIPLFGVEFTRVSSYSNYVEGVTRSNIDNAETFISEHEGNWIPQSWIEE